MENRMYVESGWSLKGILDDYYSYCESVLPEILAPLPLGNDGEVVGIYGRGRHSKLLLTAFQTLIGPIKAKLLFIDIDFDPYAEVFVGEDSIKLKDVHLYGVDSIILSSSDYEERLWETIQNTLSEDIIKSVKFYRFYDRNKGDIFWQQWQMVRFPSKPFSELPVLRFNVADAFKGSYDVPLSCVMDRFRLEVSEKPDIYIYMCYGDEHKKFTYPCVRIAWWAGESHMPDWSDCDYAVTSRVMDNESRHYRYNAMEPYNSMIQNRSSFTGKDVDALKFCNFIYSNETYGEGAQIRKKFCTKLMEYKHVDCPGRVLNNMENAITPREGDWSRGKVNFIRDYKFTIAFENERVDGYTTEKLFHPLRVGSIPIYWGNPLVSDIVDNRCFINCNDYDNDFDAVIERVKEIDNDPELFSYMLSIPPMKAGYRFDHYDGLEEFLLNIIDKELHL